MYWWWYMSTRNKLDWIWFDLIWFDLTPLSFDLTMPSYGFNTWFSSGIRQWSFPFSDFVHDCFFKGIGSLLKFLTRLPAAKLTPCCIMQQEDLTPRCITSYRCKMQWGVKNIRKELWMNRLFHFNRSCQVSSLQNAAERFASLLHYAADRFDSPQIWLAAASCSGEISAKIIDLTTHGIMQRRDLTPRLQNATKRFH